MKLTTEQRQALLLQRFREYLLGSCSQGQLLQYLRKDILGLNQTQYAGLVGISRRTLSDIEQDKGSPAKSVINKVFKPLGLQAGVILSHPHTVYKLLSTPPAPDAGPPSS